VAAYVRPYVYDSTLYMVAGATRRSIRKSTHRDRRLISLKPKQRALGLVLLSYINSPFFLKPGQPVPSSHTNYWESLQMGRTFLELGYCVDVINMHNDRFIPHKHYSFLVSTRHNLHRLAPLLNKDCVKILHCDTAAILFHNAAELRRLWELYQRSYVTLQPRRFEMPTRSLEYADYVVCLGNEFTLNTYRYANKPIYPIPISTSVLYDWPEQKSFEACRKHFLWFGSGGLVHKGLDLVLEAFAAMPEYHLTICGPVQCEEDFEQAFHKELYRTPNIHTIGWIDINSPEFKEITDRCVGLIYPSCSEGQNGGVVTCLHAGLIPIISYESGVDAENFGVILRTCTVEEIKTSIQMIASLPVENLKARARQAWEYARTHHTRERFIEEYRKVAIKIVSGEKE
jgi:glycosyltransferase involved in cell wall biosynthesis